jgi:tetratricopeptide (TPR) repeat protein
MKKLLPRTIFLVLLLAAAYLAYQQFSGSTNGAFVPYENTELQEWTAPRDAGLLRYSEERIASFQKTIDAFTETTSRDDKINNYFALAAEQQVVGRYTDAKKSLEMALALKNDAHIVHAYASLLYQMGAGADALDYLDDAIRAAPDVTNFWRTKISFVSTLYPDKKSKIEWTYKDGIKATNKDIDLVTLYASYLGANGRKNEAIQYWQMAIEKNPTAKTVYESEIANIR